MNHTAMPPVTDAHRQRAFALLSIPHMNFTQAMAEDSRRRVIEACATHLRTQDWKREHVRTVEPVKRLRLGLDGHPMSWCTQMAPGVWAPIRQLDLL